ncbi:MAG: GTP pyrophosphokinase family protein [Ruminococcus sp.]|nr:GTP pyrophosphokinase family protein [Ruminococcus sp.]
MSTTEKNQNNPDTYIEEKKSEIIPSFNEISAQNDFHAFMELQHLYDSAIKNVKTQLNIFDDEFRVKFQRNPIHSMESRLKSPQSIVGKLQKKGLPMTIESAKKNLRDIAGIRVICYYINDIYTIVDLILMHDDYQLINIKDYIRNPKPSGYRSFHMTIKVPVYLANGKQYVPIEIQIRTIAMDFWASVEHQLKYKTTSSITTEISNQLKECAEVIADTDLKMQEIYLKIDHINEISPDDES